MPTTDSHHPFDFEQDYDEERLPDGLRITLPTRQLGQIRWLGLAGVAVGLFGLLFMAVWLSIWIAAGWQLVQQGQWFGLLICAVGLCVVAMLRKCWQLLLFGMGAAANRTSSEIQIRDETITLHERFWILQWTRKIQIPISDVTALRVGVARHPRSKADDVALESWLGSYDSAIYAEVDSNKAPVVIAPCYPQPLLAKLADRLAVLLPHVAVVERQQEVQARTATSKPDEAPMLVKVVKQPVSSNVQVEMHPGGTTYRVPPAGLLKGSKGLFLFAIVWNVFISGFLIAIAVACCKQPQTASFVMLLFTIPFIAVGVGTMLAAINMGRRKTAIVTAGDELLVISEGIFGKKTRRWHASELTRVHMGPSGLSVNDVPVMELQFHSETGKFGVLSERSNDELEWLAVQVSLELGLLEIEYASPVAEEEVSPSLE